MNRRTAVTRLAFALAPILLSGCSATPLPTPSPPPPTATSAPEPAPTPSVTASPGTEWHLVIISDSWGWGLGQAYSRQIQKDLGVRVTLANYAVADLTAGEVLRSFQPGKEAGSRLEGLQAALRQAEVVVVFPSPMDSLDATTRESLRNCISRRAPSVWSTRGFAGFAEDLKAIWLKVVELRNGKPTILRATDWPNPWAADWKEANVLDACSDCWAGLSDATRQAAQDLGIPFISRYDAFNGPRHERDLYAMGYLANDRVHPNEEANTLSAKLLGTLSYDATEVRK